jgi:hypothetical protein
MGYVSILEVEGMKKIGCIFYIVCIIFVPILTFDFTLTQNSVYMVF